MGVFWNSKTSFVCSDNELEWGKQFISAELIGVRLKRAKSPRERQKGGSL